MTDLRNRRRFLRATGLAALASPSILARGASSSGAAPGRGDSTRTPSEYAGSGDNVHHSDYADPGDHTDNADPAAFQPGVRKRARRIGHRVRRSVVKITNGNAGGTGWVVEDGHVVTNAHVVDDARTYRVETFDGRHGTAVRVGYQRDGYPDVALLETDLDAPPPLSTTETASVSRGDPVLVVGHPHDVGDWVTSLGRYVTHDARTDWVLADVPVASGSSGSPLATLHGDVVGCVKGTTEREGERERLDRPEAVYAALPERERLATAVPAETVRKWTERWT